MFKRNVASVLVLALGVGMFSAACSSSSSNKHSAEGQAFLRTVLAGGDWKNMPPDPIYLAVMDFLQPKGEDAPTGGHEHPPGFVFSLTGTARVLPDDAPRDGSGPHIDVPPGQAIYADPFVHHSHTNPGPGPDDWLFLGPRNETVRPKPLPSPSAISLYAGPTLTGLNQGADYALRLDEVSIRPGGQSPAWRQGGPTLVYVFEGQVSLHRPNQPVTQMKWGTTVELHDGDSWQVRNDSGTDQAKFIIMTLWQKGQSSETPAGSII